MSFFTDDIPARAKWLICLVILCGTAALAYSLYQSIFFSDLTWLFLAGITVMGSFVPIGIPYAKGKAQSITITASDIFIFASVLIYSPEVAVSVALIDSILGNLRIKRVYRVAFNLAQLALVTYLTGHLFYFLQQQRPPISIDTVGPIWLLFINLGASALFYFVMNSGLVALAISMVTGNRVLDTWRQNFLWAWLTNITGASAAVVIFMNFERTQFFSFGIAIPVVLVIYHAYRMNNQRVETLQESQRFQATLDALSSHIALLDDSGTIVGVNAAWREFAGRRRLYNDGAGIGANYLECLESPASRNRMESTALAAGVREVITRQRDDFYIEQSFQGVDEHRWFAVRVTRFKGDGPARVVVAQEDISSQRHAEEALKISEEQLRQSQKMEAIGGLAGGVAHDFNNLLMVILGYGDMLSMEMREQDPLRSAVEEITKAANHAATLTRQLLAFSRKQVLNPKIIDLNDAVSHMGKMLRRVIGEDIQLVTMFGKALGRVKADPGQVEQVMMNLAVNARDAMPEGGKLVIETELVVIDESYDQLATGLKPGNYVVLAVSDTGCGMSEETLGRIFEPFFTTKEVGKGTGLGLATVYGIVKQSGGQVLVYSELGSGTTFKILLPQVEPAAEAAEEMQALAEAPQGSETVLLVEDEDMVRQLARVMLEKNGYTVMEASNGLDAMERSRRFNGRIDLLVTDVVMPNMKGYELAKLLMPLRPDMKVLYMSGYTGNGLHRDGVLEPNTAFLPKPFTQNTLAHKVREVLDARDPIGASEAAGQMPPSRQPGLSGNNRTLESIARS